MFDLKVEGERRGGVVHARVSMTFNGGEYRASIEDTSPGGTIVHVTDPGFVEIFGRVVKDGPPTDIVQPWEQKREIADTGHSEIQAIFTFESTRFTAEAPITGDPASPPIIM